MTSDYTDLHGKTFEGFSVEIDESKQRGDIVLDNGEFNTISMGQRDELRYVFETLDKDPRVRVVHTDNRGLGAARNEGVRHATGDLLGFTAWPYTQEALDAAEHIHDLTHSPDTTVNIDRQQRGVGGDTPGVAALLPAYRMPAGRRYDVTVRMSAHPGD